MSKVAARPKSASKTSPSKQGKDSDSSPSPNKKKPPVASSAFAAAQAAAESSRRMMREAALAHRVEHQKSKATKSAQPAATYSEWRTNHFNVIDAIRKDKFFGGARDKEVVILFKEPPQEEAPPEADQEVADAAAVEGERDPSSTTPPLIPVVGIPPEIAATLLTAQVNVPTESPDCSPKQPYIADLIVPSWESANPAEEMPSSEESRRRSPTPPPLTATAAAGQPPTTSTAAGSEGTALTLTNAVSGLGHISCLSLKEALPELEALVNFIDRVRQGPPGTQTGSRISPEVSPRNMVVVPPSAPLPTPPVASSFLPPFQHHHYPYAPRPYSGYVGAPPPSYEGYYHGYPIPREGEGGGYSYASAPPPPPGRGYSIPVPHSTMGYSYNPADVSVGSVGIDSVEQRPSRQTPPISGYPPPPFRYGPPMPGYAGPIVPPTAHQVPPVESTPRPYPVVPIPVEHPSTSAAASNSPSLKIAFRADSAKPKATASGSDDATGAVASQQQKSPNQTTAKRDREIPIDTSPRAPVAPEHLTKASSFDSRPLPMPNRPFPGQQDLEKRATTISPPTVAKPKPKSRFSPLQEVVDIPVFENPPGSREDEEEEHPSYSQPRFDSPPTAEDQLGQTVQSIEEELNFQPQNRRTNRVWKEYEDDNEQEDDEEEEEDEEGEEYEEDESSSEEDIPSYAKPAVAVSKPKPAFLDNDDRVVCPHCNLRYFKDRIAVHIALCAKQTQPPAPSAATAAATKPPAKPASAAATAKAAPPTSATSAKPQPAVAAAAVAPNECEYCHRTFAKDALDRHVRICRTLANNRKKL